MQIEFSETRNQGKYTNTERIVIDDKITLIEEERMYGNGKRRKLLYIRGQENQKLDIIRLNLHKGEIEIAL